MISLKLDTNAVLKLFGDEESRVELQQAVINNVVQELVLKNSKNKVQETIQKEISLVGARLPDVNVAVREQFDLFFKKKGWNDIEGTLALDTKMSEAANRIAYERVTDAINKQVDDAIADLEGRIERTIKLSEERMEMMITTALQNRFTKSLDKAIAARIKTLFPEA